MTAYAALLRAVNVGGTGKLPMSELRAMCETLGFAKVRTYIASGNVVFESQLAEKTVKAKLEKALDAYVGKPVGVLVRSGAELAAILAANPFASAAGNQTVVIFLDAPPPSNVLAKVSGQQSEEIVAGTRELYVHYPNGIGQSKLKIPAASTGTARNMNTVAKLAEWSSE
ncbi:DUF1697 domain-containing protein [Paraburkholderia sp. DHOC27]|uniref:DUF1697 domain-containing protein n=1 Tax=Paraburkholderia sp. DHOC27 TaxID=2303330 RepID=UPI000E3CFD33|nr:DUF1697 domain-containing protein [Paraburkholderia sp. DHOC27]RFU48402.1 DUF1697 domain-containing protein [Paraburkholderia sp. DHOC27]